MYQRHGNGQCVILYTVVQGFKYVYIGRHNWKSQFVTRNVYIYGARAWNESQSTQWHLEHSYTVSRNSMLAIISDATLVFNLNKWGFCNICMVVSAQTRDVNILWSEYWVYKGRCAHSVHRYLFKHIGDRTMHDQNS